MLLLCSPKPRIAAAGRYKNTHAWAHRPTSMQATMISNAAVLCLVLFSAGQLAAASKSFGGDGSGGYGGEAGGHHEEPDVLPQLPLLTPAAGVQDESPATPYGPEDDSATPATPSDSSSSTPSTGGGEQASGAGASSSTKSKGYGSGQQGVSTPSSSSSTPSTGGDKQASGAGASSSTKSKGYGSGQQGGSTPSSTTPASSGKASASASASGGGSGQQGGTPSSSSSSTPSSTTPAAGGAAGYGLDPAGEPEYGLNQKAIDDILKEHNAFRAKEHVPPLTWNATLAKFSQQYAEKTLKGPCQMVHSTSPYGENLMLGTGGITWKTTVDQWEDEKKSYHYGSNSCDAGKMCGHYTAVVWKGTTSVGCGRVKCNNGDTMIMCSYWPPGNYDGERPY